MKNILLVLAYDGSAFHGWQAQKNAGSVQQTLSEALFALTGERVMPAGAGRTDAGVHAWAQIASFQTDSAIPPERFAYALNSLLPKSMAVISSYEVPSAFHPRMAAAGKWYRYCIYNAAQRSPLHEGRAWHVAASLNLQAMQKAAEQVVGDHDFRAFCASGHSVKTYTRRIDSAQWSQEGARINFDICGSGFLYNMVRILVGTMVEIGRNQREIETMAIALRTGERTDAGKTAPAGGLYMMQVFYEGLENPPVF